MARWSWVWLALGCGGLGWPGWFGGASAPTAAPTEGPLDPELARIAAMPPGNSVLHDLALFVRDHDRAPPGCAPALAALVDTPFIEGDSLPTAGCTDACGVDLPPILIEGDTRVVEAQFPQDLARARTAVVRACDARGPDPLFQGPLAAARAGVCPATYVVVRTLIAPLIARGQWSPALARTVGLSVLRVRYSPIAPPGAYGRADLQPVLDALADCPGGFGSARVVVDEQGHVVPEVESGPAQWCKARAERSVAVAPGDVGVVDYAERLRRPVERMPRGPHRLEVEAAGVVVGVIPMSTNVELTRFAGDDAWSVVAPVADRFEDHLVGPGGVKLQPALIVSQERSPTEIQLSHVLPGLWDFVGDADGVLAPGGTVVARGRWRFAGDPTDTLHWVGVTPSGLVVRDEGEGTVTVRWIE